MYEEIFRVLDDEAIFISISHATPVTRVPYLRQVKWAIDTMKLPEGESLILYSLTKTADEVLLNRKVIGGEASLPQHQSAVVSKTDQNMNKNSTTKQPGGGGKLTVTADVDYIENLITESLEGDGGGDD